jgi:hypothetical protein
MKNPRCLVAAPVLAGRTQITALGTKPRLSLVACVFLVLAVPVAGIQAQSDVPPPNAAASFVSGHLQCVAYYATMSECLSRFSQKDETRYFNAAAAFLTRARELGGLYGEGPEIQEATTRELATVMERSVGSRCEKVRKLTDLRPLHDRYNDFCKVVGQKLQGESAATIARDLDLNFNEQDGVPLTEGEAPAQVVTARSPQPQPERAPHIGWMIQLGAFADEAEAEKRLRSAHSMAQNLLGEADGFTERVTKGSKGLYRVRFAGLDKDTAEAACHYFKRNEIECIALKH